MGKKRKRHARFFTPCKDALARIRWRMGLSLRRIRAYMANKRRGAKGGSDA